MAVALTIVLEDHLVYRPHAPRRDGDEARTVYTGLFLDDPDDPARNGIGISGTPTELRRLAQALDGAAHQADAWAAEHPADQEGR